MKISSRSSPRLPSPKHPLVQPAGRAQDSAHRGGQGREARFLPRDHRKGWGQPSGASPSRDKARSNRPPRSRKAQAASRKAVSACGSRRGPQSASARRAWTIQRADGSAGSSSVPPGQMRREPGGGALGGKGGMARSPVAPRPGRARKLSATKLKPLPGAAAKLAMRAGVGGSTTSSARDRWGLQAELRRQRGMIRKTQGASAAVEPGQGNIHRSTRIPTLPSRANLKRRRRSCTAVRGFKTAKGLVEPVARGRMADRIRVGIRQLGGQSRSQTGAVDRLAHAECRDQSAGRRPRRSPHQHRCKSLSVCRPVRSVDLPGRCCRSASAFRLRGSSTRIERAAPVAKITTAIKGRCAGPRSSRRRSRFSQIENIHGTNMMPSFRLRIAVKRQKTVATLASSAR